MLHLETIFKNFFADKNISDDHLKEFTEDHLQRLITNNGSGMFTQVLTDTQSGYNGYFGNIANEDVNTAVRKSLTMSADNLMATFKKTVSRKEGTIKGLYAVDSPAYQEFFPQGITEYSKATKANIETLMNRMVNASIAHIADLSTSFVQIFTDLRDNYVTARTLQLGKKGDVTTHKTATKTSRTVLELQLTKNIHYIGYNFPGDITLCISFFDQRIIHRAISSDSDGLGRAAGIITAEGIAVKDAHIDFADVQTRVRKSKTDGSYRTVNVTAEKHTIRVKKAGFKDFETSVIITDEGDTPLNIELQPE